MLAGLVSTLTTVFKGQSGHLSYVRKRALLEKHIHAQQFLHCVDTGIVIAHCRTYSSSRVFPSKNNCLSVPQHPSNVCVVWHQEWTEGASISNVFLKVRLWNCDAVPSLQTMVLFLPVLEFLDG